MKKFLNKLSEYFWGEAFSPWYLIITASVLMLLFLGGRDLWTQESRWANICQQMILRHDYLHPFLDNSDYYDKPLLSYWMMVGFSYIFGFTRWALRFPGIIAGLVSIWCSFKICEILSGRRTGILAAWMLTTTVFFVYWSRVACADVLNVGGILLAVTWFLIRKDNLDFFTYLILFLIITAAALCKGLVAPAVTFLILLPILLRDRKWKEYLRPSMFLAAVISGFIYAIPFVISLKTNSAVPYQGSGLHEVFRENVVRYFDPYDHTGPVYTYFVYLPAYALPWILFTVFGLYRAITQWKKLEFPSKFYIITLVLTFAFFTCSGSRRSYYVLPMVPLAIFIAADWLNSELDKRKILRHLTSTIILISAITIIVLNTVFKVSEIGSGVIRFSSDVTNSMASITPFNRWDNITFIGVKDDLARKATFYLNPDKLPRYFEYKWNENSRLSDLPAAFDERGKDVFIIPQNSLKYLQKDLDGKSVTIIETYPTIDDRITGKKRNKNFLAAIIPNEKL